MYFFPLSKILKKAYKLKSLLEWTNRKPNVSPVNNRKNDCNRNNGLNYFFQLVGGELGGKNATVKWITSFLLFTLWITYIVLSSLRAYDIITW